MTIASALAEWLSKIESLSIDTNHITDGSDKYGLFKAPNRDIKNHIDGSYEITEYYDFFARQASVSQSDRQDSDEWLENLSYMADDAGTIYELPDLDGNRRVISITLTGAPYVMESGSNEVLYHMSISVTYEREIEV